MERRLAAILATDMVGYSRLMEQDEEGVLLRQKAGMSRLLLKFVEQALLVKQATQPWPSVQGRG